METAETVPARLRFLAVAALLTMASMIAPSVAGAGTVLQPGNILVSDGRSVLEYTPAGVLVQTVSVPYPGPDPFTENTRDLVSDETGHVHVYNGTFDPYLSSYDLATEQWRHDTHPGWSTVNNVSYGGIARLGRFVFVSDMSTFGEEADRLAGIVRFDLVDGSSIRFAEPTEFIDLYLGLDGLLYGLVGDEVTVHVFDPSSMAAVRTFTLAAAVRGIAVDGSGRVFGASWDGNLYRFTPSGAVVTTLPTGSFNLSDIDVSPGGQLVIGGRFGDVILSTTELTTVTRFAAGSDPVFVAVVLAMDTGPDAAKCPSDTPTIVGTPSSDRIVGTPGRDIIHGLGGDDVIVGLDGDDVICAGDGQDSVAGGGGADRLFGDDGADQLSGGDGSDLVVGGSGADQATGDAGDDVLDGRDQASGDLLVGGFGSADACRSDPGDTRVGCES